MLGKYQIEELPNEARGSPFAPGTLFHKLKPDFKNDLRNDRSRDYTTDVWPFSEFNGNIKIPAAVPRVFHVEPGLAKATAERVQRICNMPPPRPRLDLKSPLPSQLESENERNLMDSSDEYEGAEEIDITHLLMEDEPQRSLPKKSPPEKESSEKPESSDEEMPEKESFDEEMPDAESSDEEMPDNSGKDSFSDQKISGNSSSSEESKSPPWVEKARSLIGPSESDDEEDELSSLSEAPLTKRASKPVVRFENQQFEESFEEDSDASFEAKPKKSTKGKSSKGKSTKKATKAKPESKAKASGGSFWPKDPTKLKPQHSEINIPGLSKFTTLDDFDALQLHNSKLFKLWSTTMSSAVYAGVAQELSSNGYKETAPEIDCEFEKALDLRCRTMLFTDNDLSLKAKNSTEWWLLLLHRYMWIYGNVYYQDSKEHEGITEIVFENPLSWAGKFGVAPKAQLEVQDTYLTAYVMMRIALCPKQYAIDSGRIQAKGMLDRWQSKKEEPNAKHICKILFKGRFVEKLFVDWRNACSLAGVNPFPSVDQIN